MLYGAWGDSLEGKVFTTVLILFSFSLLAMGLGWAYYGRYQMARPPIGVFNLWDVGVMMVGILAVPYLYLILPRGWVAGLLGLSAANVLYFCLEPVVVRRGSRWALVALLLLLNVTALYHFGPGSRAFFSVNNLVQLIVVVGITNLWAQSGLKARDAAILGVALTIYDLVFTSYLPLTDTLFTRLDGLPFAPLVGWSWGEDRWIAIGVGDLLLATVFPLVMRRAYGPHAGVTSFVLASSALMVVFALPLVGLLQMTFPVMVVLGPLIAVQVWWHHPGSNTNPVTVPITHIVQLPGGGRESGQANTF